MHIDQEMQLRWISGRDADAFTNLVIRHAGMVFATCRRVLGNPTEAEDVAQECFLELAQRTRVVKPSLGGWLHRVAVYRSLNRLKSDSRRKTREKRYVDEHAQASITEWDDIKPHLDAAIAELPDRFRLPVIHRFLEGQTQEEVARNLGISRTTAQYRINRGVDEIRMALKRRGVTVATAVLVGFADSMTAEAAPASLIAALGERTIAAYSGAAETTYATNAGMLRAALFSWKGAVGITLGILAGVAVLGGLARTTTSPIANSAGLPAHGTSAAEPLRETQRSVERSHAGSNEVVAEAASEGAIVSGRIYAKGNNEPFPFFHVAAYRAGNESDPVAETVADEDGIYRLDRLPEGDYTIRSWDNRLSYNEQVKGEARSGAPCRAGQIELHVDAGSEATHADIGLDVGLCLLGYVVLEDGSPVNEALVWARGESEGHQYWAERVSGATGRFMFIGLEPNTEIFVQASGDGYASQVMGPFTVGDQDVTNMQVVLEPAASIEGIVLAQGSNPVPGAKIWLQPDADTVVHPRFVTCDETGHFEAEGLADGIYDFVLAPLRTNPTDEDTDTSHFFWGSIERVYTDPEPVLRTTLRPGEHRTGLRLMFHATGISGRVTDISGRPLAQVRITMMGGAEATTDDDGRYVLVGVPEGSHSVYASHEDYRPDRLDDIGSGSRDADFVLERRGVVEGQVVDARTGAPIDAFSLHTGIDRPYESWMDAWFEEHRDPDGRFRYKPNFVTERIFARAKGYALNSVLAERVVDGQPPTRVTIALEPGARVEGVVRRADGRPVQDALVFQGVLPSREREREGAVLAKTDAEGRFTLDSLPAGPVTLVAFHELLGYGESSTSGDDRRSETLEIVLDDFGKIEGRIVAEGQPVAGQPVTIIIFQGEPSLDTLSAPPRSILRGKTDVDGAFIFHDLPAGYAQVSCELGSRRRFTNVGIVPAETIEVTIDFPPLTAQLEGRVQGLQNAPTDEILVMINVETPTGGEPFYTALNPERAYLFDGLPAGAAQMSIRVSDTNLLRVPDVVSILDGTAITKDIDITACVPVTLPGS